jgi:23S rRNA (cytosine1962-C5)-methyltransferase
MVFSKTPLANRSLAAQFATHAVRKKYLLLTDRAVPQGEFAVKSALVRVGDRYLSRPLHAGGATAETRFRLIAREKASGQAMEGGNPKTGNRNPREIRRLKSEVRRPLSEAGWYEMVEAEPVTGRTHQIRVHAAEQGFPILGDTLYGGTPAPRVYLHAVELRLRHPVSGQEMTFRPPMGQGAHLAGTTQGDWRWLMSSRPCLALREALIGPESTNAYRLIHGASDSRPGWHVERLGDFVLSQSEHPLSPAQRAELAQLAEACSARGAYHKILMRQVRRTAPADASPQLVLGEAAPERFTVRENGVQFELSFRQGGSVGLFLDQRDNRRRLLTGHVAAGFPLLQSPPQLAIGNRRWAVLNTFAYTCGFSVCAAKAGARTTSLDLSKKWLDWGQRNFALNRLDPARHEFIYGDALDWLRRLGKKQRRFDVILLDPPTFSQSKASGVFRAEQDYGRLVTAALPLLRSGGVLFASTNAADWPPEEFLAGVEAAIHAANRKVLQRHYVPQPPDFPISRAEPAYLKTVWLRVE